MSAKLIVLEEAAAMLGMSPEELTELRSNNEIFGYRDGKTWKFKESEIERFANQREIEMRANPGDSVKIGGGDSLGEPLSVDIDADLDELVDVGEVNLDEPLVESADAMVTDDDDPSGKSSSSTIIGKSALPDELGSDLIGALDDDLVADSGSETSVGLPSADEVESIEIVDADDSEIKITEESGLLIDELGGSDLKLAPGSHVSIEAGEVTEEAEPEVLATGSSSELKLAASDSQIKVTESDEDIVLGDDDASDMDIDLSESLDLSDEDLEITLDSSSEIDLDGGDIELDGGETGVGLAMGSDITLNAGESGINLAVPTDSGISLEQTPGEISIEEDEVLELGEAAEIEFEDAGEELLDEEGLQADDEFLLTPVGGDALEESDSGSQVIALDTEELEEGEATILQDEAEGFEAIPEDDDEVEPAAMPVAPGLAAAPEAGYSLGVVLALCTVALPLALGGFMMLDLVRHMWTWDEPYTINSSLMDFILSMFGSSR